MEVGRRSSLRRKPLADCTNTIPAARRTFSSSAIKSSAAAAVVKLPKTSNSAAAKPKPEPEPKPKPKPKPEPEPEPKPKPKSKPPISSGYLKTNTSTGSNNSPNVDSVIPVLHLSDPPAPVTPLADSGGRDHRKHPAAQSQQDEKTRKDKEEMQSEMPIIQEYKPAECQATLRSSSTASGLPVVQNQKLDARKRKDKGKAVLETPNVGTTDLLRPHVNLKLSSATVGDFHPSGPPAVENQKLDAQKRKDKGKMVIETPIIEITNTLRPHVYMPSSSAAAGNFHFSEPPAVQNHTLDAQKRKDKGKMVLETPIINMTGLLRPHISLAGSAAAGGFHLSKPPGFQEQTVDAQKRKDKGKMVLETPMIETTDLLRPHISLASSSAAASNFYLTGLPAAQNQTLGVQKRKDRERIVLETSNVETTDFLRRHISVSSSSAAASNFHLPGKNKKLDEQNWKDKGKMVLETPNVETTGFFRPQISLASSSSTASNSHLSGPPAVRNQKPDAQERKDKGKRVLETLTIKKTYSSRLQFSRTSSSVASGTSHLSWPPAAENQKLDAPKSKDKGKMVQTTVENEAIDPSTPHALLGSSSATSGDCDQERSGFLTVYDLRRAPQRRKHADLKSTAFSCPPNKRTKKMGRVELDGDCGKWKSGSYTDPPLHKKKQSRNKHDDSVHTMSQDEIERLRAYYAEIDAFELPEEDASESD